MSTSGRWSPSEVGPSPAPQSSIKCDFHTDGYRVALTDLVDVWQESLSREQIYTKAERQRCSINPREAEDQSKILSDKISEALTRSKDTTLRINKQQSEDDLTIVLSAPLPAPLPKLEWRIDFAKQGPPQLSDEIVYPLLNRAYTQEQHIKQLTLHSREKDHVISRLSDRMEASNTDSTAIFPGVSNIRISRKASQRSQLAKYVKGLEPYEDVAYSTSADLPSPPPAQSLEILGTLPDPSQDGTKSSSRLGLGLPRGQDPDEGAQTIGKSLQNKSLNAEDSETDEDMDDFQTQESPPHLVHPSRGTGSLSPGDTASGKPKAGSLSTEDIRNVAAHHGKGRSESHDGAQSTEEGTAPRIRPTSRKRLGVIKKAPKEASPDHTTAEESEQVPEQKPSRIKKTHEERAKSHESDDLPSQNPKPTTRSKLGVIGGRHKAEPSGSRHRTPSLPPTSSVHGDIEVPSPVSTATRDTEDPDDNDAEKRIARTEKRPVNSSPPPRETSQERADRKRQELKHQLEEKAKSPRKKKRRF